MDGAELISRAEQGPAMHAASAYAAAGVAVLPCVPRGKRPLTRHGFKDACTDLDIVAAWWARWPDANIGLVTGGAGFDVLDVDNHPAGRGFRAFERVRQAGLVREWLCIVRTPSGGLHIYFPALPERPQGSWSLASAHVDFRGTGGYVLAPPSVITVEGTDRWYEVIADGTDRPWIDAAGVREFLAPPPRRSYPRVEVTAGRSDEDRLAAWLARRPEGQRNTSLYWAACRCAEGGLSEDRAWATVGAAAQQAGLPVEEVEATIRSAYRALRSPTGRDRPSSVMRRGGSVAL